MASLRDAREATCWWSLLQHNTGSKKKYMAPREHVRNTEVWFELHDRGKDFIEKVTFELRSRDWEGVNLVKRGKNSPKSGRIKANCPPPNPILSSTTSASEKMVSTSS